MFCFDGIINYWEKILSSFYEALCLIFQANKEIFGWLKCSHTQVIG